MQLSRNAVSLTSIQEFTLSNNIFKNEAARKRMENWYQRFLGRIDGEISSKEISTSYGESHVLMIGDPSKSPLVCLHAMMTSSAHLASELDTLLDQFYIIAPDLPGQSIRGIPARLAYTENSHVQWLLEILDGLNLQQIHLLGISLGGFIARQFASSNPGRVKSLVLIVPAGIAQGSLVKGFAKMALPMIMYKINPSDNNLRKLVNPLITTWDEDWARNLGDSFNDFSTNLEIPPVASDDELKNLNMPCLVIGAEDDISFPGKKVIERTETHIPNVKTELIKNSRHCPPTTPEFRKWLGKRVKTFIKRLNGLPAH